MKIRDWLRGFIAPGPSLFDFCVAGCLFISQYRGTAQSLFFVLYSFFVVLLTVGMTPKREYKSLPLVLFAVWAIIGIFTHNRVIVYPKNSFMNSYFVTTTMFEGAIYVVAGVLLLNAIVRYSTNLKFAWLLLPGALIPIAKYMIHGGSMTVFFALGVASIIYLFVRRMFLAGYLASVVTFLLFAFNFKWVCMKWEARPLVWQHLIHGIKEHPFIGRGFCEYLWGNMTWVDPDKFGWAYRHNDYLSIGDYLGVAALILVAWFVVDTIRKIGTRPALIGFLTIAIMCFFQMTMFYTDRAMVCLLITGMILTGANKKGEVA
jgi:hypothetical protein